MDSNFLLTNLPGFAVGILTGFIANYITPRSTYFLDRFFGSIFNAINPDRYDLTGKWEQTFTEPEDANCVNWVTEQESDKLIHIGNRISGKGQTKILPRFFIYDLKVKHNMVFGSYIKKGEKGNITGVGMIQLIVSPDRLEMTGQATWFDSDTKQIESSKSNWKKIG